MRLKLVYIIYVALLEFMSPASAGKYQRAVQYHTDLNLAVNMYGSVYQFHDKYIHIAEQTMGNYLIFPCHI